MDEEGDDYEQPELVPIYRRYDVYNALKFFYVRVWDFATLTWQEEIMCVHIDRITWHFERSRRPLYFISIYMQYSRFGQDCLGRVADYDRPREVNVYVQNLVLLEIIDEDFPFLLHFNQWRDIVNFVELLKAILGIRGQFILRRCSQESYELLERFYYY